MEKKEFPSDFLWGVATSAFQTEGHNTNSDWWKWEHSEERTQELLKQNQNPQDYVSDLACDSYNRYEEDLDLAANLNLKAFRLSIEWARIEPKEGEFDQKEIEHYRKVLEGIKRRGMQTFVTFHHFTNPLWFAEKGGWEKGSNVQYFVRYAEKISTELSDLIDFICVINEINYGALHAYGLGTWTPQIQNPLLAYEVYNNMIDAHVRTYKLLKSKGVKAPICSCAATFVLISENSFLKMLVPLFEFFSYRHLLKKLNKYSDALAFNYYTVRRAKLSWRLPFISFIHPEVASDYGWEIYAPGIMSVLDYCKKFNKPVYITENGIADAQDKFRKKYIHDHLEQIHSAVTEGIPVKGYFHWSLIDNMELTEGYKYKFGLVAIDRENNLERKPRPSYYYYSEICKSNSLLPL